MCESCMHGKLCRGLARGQGNCHWFWEALPGAKAIAISSGKPCPGRRQLPLVRGSRSLQNAWEPVDCILSSQISEIHINCGRDFTSVKLYLFSYNPKIKKCSEYVAFLRRRGLEIPEIPENSVARAATFTFRGGFSKPYILCFLCS